STSSSSRSAIRSSRAVVLDCSPASSFQTRDGFICSWLTPAAVSLDGRPARAQVRGMANLIIDAAIESWPLASAFVISRGAKREARVVVARVSDGTATGRGECVPYPRYGQTPERTLDAIQSAPGDLDRDRLNRHWPPDAARNALDCALWDLEAKRTGRSAADLAGIGENRPVLTCYTVSLGTPEVMAAAARAVPNLPLLKLKLGGDGDAQRMRGVRQARPDARLV